MFKLLVLSCLVVSCLAEPFGLPSWLRGAGRPRRHPRGCADRAEGWRACAQLNGTDSLAPHGHDCSLFFYCSSAARPACRKCPAGLHFNPQLQVCDWPENVDCTPRPPRPSRPPHPRPNGTTIYPATPEDHSTMPDEYPTTVEDNTTTDAPGTDAPATDAPATNAPVTDTPVSDAPATDAPATDAPATDATVTYEPTIMQ